MPYNMMKYNKKYSWEKINKTTTNKNYFNKKNYLITL